MLKGALARGLKNLMVKHTDYIKQLSENWAKCGVNSGDTLLVHSNIKRTLVTARRKGIQLTPDDVLNSFLDSLGSAGTLILPLFNFDFPTTKHFDIRKTPSQMGALTEAARKRSDAVRTGHPIYSFAVLRKEKGKFDGLVNESGYGENSPFGLLRALDGKIASLDLEDQDSMTFYHYVEESMAVDYRYFKTFSGTYIAADGYKSERGFKLFVRDIDRKVFTNVNPAGELLWKAGLYRGDRPKENFGLRTIEAASMFRFVTNLIKEGRAEGNLFFYGQHK